MDLPMFNSEGDGPQGIGNISPENFRGNLTPADMDLLNATSSPLDSPAVQQSLDRHIEATMSPSGVMTPLEESRQTAAVAPETPPTTPAQPSTQAAPPEGFEGKLRSVYDKYGNDYNELAKAYLNINRTSLQTNQENSDLRREMSEMKQLLVDMASGNRPAYQNANQPQAEPVPLTPDDFYRDPIATTSKIISDQLVGFAQALESQRVSEQRENEFRRSVTTRQTEIERLSPIMEDIAGKRPELYRALPRETALDLLIEQARDREAAMKGTSQLAEVYQSMGWQPQAAPAPQTYQPSPTLGAGGIAGGGSPSTRAALPPTPGGQGVAGQQSNALRRIMSSVPDTFSEDRALGDYLKERGFGEHIPIY